MAIKKTDEQNYIDIANAIRAKNGSSETYTPGEMEAAILALAGITVSTTLSDSGENEVSY